MRLKVVNADLFYWSTQTGSGGWVELDAREVVLEFPDLPPVLPYRRPQVDEDTELEEALDTELL